MLEAYKKSAKATHERIEAIEKDVKTSLAQVESLQKAVGEVKMMLKKAKGPREEISSSKRALVFLTTVAAGIGLFALNAMGARSGE